METKILEIRDAGTCIPALCVNMNPSNATQTQIMVTRGYPCDDRPNILLTHLDANGTPAWNDPYAWGGRTWPIAHNYIIFHWSELKDGDVVDVQYIIGESPRPKPAELHRAIAE